MNKYKRPGFTLVEMIVAMVINMIVILGVGVLLIGGNRSWQKCYNTANHQIKQDAIAATLEFGNVGRKSNRLSYTIYKREGDTYFKALPRTGNPEEIVSGDAVEFGYWDSGLDSSDSQNLMDTTKIATAYAFFYIDGKKLKVDKGPYPPGAITNGRRNTAGITTTILADNVLLSDSDDGVFSHTTVNGVGQGSVRINITLKNIEDNESVQIMTATYLRNIWPR
ncbi:MAG: prepilin-type N-terminal cleavage/methylation domain-containing protein [Sedimentisphaerales bacterium]|nr:prepilin-type N-terminal cleavage/methylation domain-containing protein [Sedimentisphaerales bacterium]